MRARAHRVVQLDGGVLVSFQGTDEDAKAFCADVRSRGAVSVTEWTEEDVVKLMNSDAPKTKIQSARGRERAAPCAAARARPRAATNAIVASQQSVSALKRKQLKDRNG